MKLISFSLFGNDPKYVVGLFRNIELKTLIYPDWDIIVYYDNSVASGVLEKLKAYGVILRDMTKSGILAPSWRFVVNNEEGCERFIIRDADSRLSYREAHAVKEWEDSNKILHIMRDHPHHGRPIMGGMWGMMSCPEIDMATAIINHQGGKWNNQPHRQEWFDKDQHFLLDDIYPKFATEKDSLIHHASDCSIAIAPESWAKDFPDAISSDKYFIGEIFYFDHMGNEQREYQYKER